MRPLCVTLFVLGSLGPVAAVAQTVHGRLLDAFTRQPVIGADVRLVQGDRTIVSAASDSAGRFTIGTRQPGRYQLSITRIGYGDLLSQFIELTTDQVVNTELQMSSQAVKLAPLTLDVPRDRYLESSGFYERMRTGTGDFLTTDQIQRRNTPSLVELLRGLRGVKIQRTNWKQEIYFSSSSCLPMIVVDGVTVRWGGRPVATVQPLDDLVPVGHISAVESYRGGSGIPPEFIGPNASCGVILIWTRHK